MKTEIEHRTEIGILEKDRQAVADLLNGLLADEFTLYAKTRNFHWNVTGPRFGTLHKLFESQYEELNGFIDKIAERARALGHHALGGLRAFAEKTRLGDAPEKELKDAQMIEMLLEDHESVIRALRKDVGLCADRHHDAGTSDFLLGLMKKHEKTAWMLRSHLGAT